MGSKKKTEMSASERAKSEMGFQPSDVPITLDVLVGNAVLRELSAYSRLYPKPDHAACRLYSYVQFIPGNPAPKSPI